MDDDLDKAQIIIKFTTNRKGIFDNVHKYSSFLNHLLSKYMSSAFFIENIDNGVIFFFKSIVNYHAVNIPYDKSVIEDFTKNKEEYLEKMDIMTEDLLPQDLSNNFPKEGINFYYSLVKGDPEKILPNSIRHFKSYDENNIEIEKQSRDTLKIKMNSLNSLETYLFERLLLTSGLIEEYSKMEEL